MPTSYLWAVSCFGKIYRLSITDNRWEETRRKWQRVRGFKRVTAVKDCAWAIGSNLQLYVFVHASDVPIRFQEVTYENERWNPVTGFSGQKLLPNDRWHWSDEDGKEYTPQGSFRLPTTAWEWEDRWYVDENLHGELTGKGGWQYAMDFSTAAYSANQRWNSFVRRRKWIRHRRYVATDFWTKVPDVHFDPTVEPIIDVSIGGAEMPNRTNGFYCVWAVTLLGKVVFRRGVCRECPEGTSWEVVPIQNGQEVISVSVGPTGLVWCIQWDGQGLVRCGVCWDNLIGSHWAEVESPGENYRLSQASVGVNVVWAVSREGKIWFRKNVQACAASSDDSAATGSSWIEMVGEMGMVSVGANDQVWGIGLDDKCVYHRTGIHADDLAGKTWKPIHLLKERRLPSQVNEAEDLALSGVQMEPSSLVDVAQLDDMSGVLGGSLPVSVLRKREIETLSKHSTIDCGTPVPVSIANVEHCLEKMSSNLKLPDSLKCCSRSDYLSFGDCGTEESRSHCKAYPTTGALDITMTITKSNYTRVRFQELSPVENTDSGCGSSSESKQLERSDSLSSTTSDTMINFVNDFEESTEEVTDMEQQTLGTNPQTSHDTNLNSSGEHANIIQDFSAVTFKSKKKKEILSFSPVKSDCERDTGVCDEDGDRDTADQTYRSWEDEFDYDDAEYDDTSWVWVSGGGCTMDPLSTLPWFSGKIDSRRESMAVSQQWRNDLLALLKARNKLESTQWKHYGHAIDRASWMKSGAMQWWRDDKREKWTECTVELELGMEKLDGYFTVQYTSHKKLQHVQCLISDIVCVWTVNDPTHQPVFGVYTAPRIDSRSPIKLLTRTEEELEDWVTVLSMACCDIRAVGGIPAPRSVWSTTARGDVFLHEPLPTLDGTPLEQLFWHQLGGHLRVVETCSAGVVCGLAYDNTAWVYSGGYGGGIFKGLASSATGIQSLVDKRQMCIYENQLWNPVTGYSYKTLPFYRAVWTDRSGRHEFTKENYSLPSRHWSWTSDWRVDHNAPGGTDRDGWQYARDFSMEYHGRRGWNDYVRRRRWSRECKIVTSGPWREVGNIPLLDVSLQVDLDLDVEVDKTVAMWAVTQTGDVLCRCDVTRRNPQGTSWRHVTTDQPFVSISIGGSYRVWAVARDGSPWFRNGITAKNITGTCWFHATLPPNGYTLKQISAGLTAVWAVDTKNQLWYRKNITKTYPEGTEWLFVCTGIKHVSVGPKDQVWVIAESVPSQHGPVNGVVCRRMGINHVNPTGNRWDQGIGGGWQHVSVRGCCEDSAELAYSPDVAAIQQPVSQWEKEETSTLMC